MIIIIIMMSDSPKKYKKKKSKKSLSSVTANALGGEETARVLYSGRDSEPVGPELIKWSH